MKPFCLEAAQRGEKVRHVHSGNDVHFVGVTSAGTVVAEFLCGSISRVAFADLCMAPKPPRKMWVQVFIGGDDRVKCTNPKGSPEGALLAANNFKPLGEPQEILVPEGE